MTESDKHKIATSFPDTYETGILGLEISLPEYKIFENGIFANSMEEKWHVFILNENIYFTRSWTGYCIYKIFIKRQRSAITLTDFHVNRDENQYRSKDLDHDTILLKELLQMFLNRTDFYSDPKLELPLIKKTIENVDPNSECIRSIGSNDVGLTRQIYNGLTTEEQQKYADIIGWAELKAKIENKNDDEPLISLYLQNKVTKWSTTYYFDKDANELLGQITTKSKINSSGLE